MSTHGAKPRPWTLVRYDCTVHRACLGHLDIRAADGTEVLPAPLSVNERPTAELIVGAVNSLPALLAVAKAAPAGEDAVHWLFLPQALAALDAAFPTWREWA